MNVLTINIIACSAYLVATGILVFSVFGKHQRLEKRSLPLCLAGIGLVAHIFSVAQSVFVAEGTRLDFFNVSPLIAAFITFLTLAACLTRPLENLLTVLLPISILSIITAAVFGKDNPAKFYSLDVNAHILLSILAYSLFAVAALQAIFLSIQDRLLKHHQLKGLVNALPPLQSMESMLFEIIVIGLILLTASIATGIIFIDDFFAQHLAHKSLFSIIAWFIFSILIWGRYQAGWRGATVIRWTLTGYALLMIGYFGSKFVLEFILN